MQKANRQRNKNIILSFHNAWRGFWTVLIQEPAFKYMALSGLLVVLAMLYFPTSRMEKAVLLVMVFSVLGLEMINSIMERFLDFLQPNHDPRVKIIKDLLSGFVFLVVIGSAIIGLLVFWPYFKTTIDF
ncbi:diacylglycerol kinase family protein [Patescibacteria group bacterium]|nr:diacylglycerol kinase family protein [Patescibacteria group bacterium]